MPNDTKGSITKISGCIKYPANNRIRKMLRKNQVYCNGKTSEDVQSDSENFDRLYKEVSDDV